MSDPSRPLLILPAGYGDGPEVRRLAQVLGVPVIGASSVENDPAAADYAHWLRLPHVSDPAFEAELSRAIARHGVGRIHVSHYALWHRLKDRLEAIAPGVTLTLGRNNFDLTADYEALRTRVGEHSDEAFAEASAPHAAPNAALAAGMMRAAMSIPGESYEPKLLALVEVARRAPPGDVVEIGCLFGRTAALLAMLADHYDLGRVLCVDPWSVRSTEQGNEALQSASQGFAWDSFRRIFEVNVAPFARGRLNYIQALSTDGYQRYAAGEAVETDAFGRTDYEGRIGLLHIDGNHDLAYVAADARDWVPHVKPGGWIVFDDYEWDWGDGVRQVGDAFLRDEAARIQASFVIAGALFVQLR